MLKFLDGHLLGTTSSAGAPAEPPAGGGGGGAPPTAPPANDKTAFSFPTEKAFAEYLPDKFKALPNFRDIKSFDGLLDSFVSQQKLVGLDKNRLLVAPKDDNDNEALTNIYASLGRPEKVDGYTIPDPGDGKTYSDGDKAFQAAVLPVLHEAGLTQRQVAAIVPKWNALQEAAAAAAAEKDQAAIAAADAALTKEWGAAKAAKLADATAAMGWLDNELKLGGALTKALEQTDAAGNKLGNNPALAKLFAYFGAQMKEDGLIGKGEAGSGQAQYSPAEAKQQIAALESEKDFMKVYRDRKDPGHAQAVAKMGALYAQAFPPEDKGGA